MNTVDRKKNTYSTSADLSKKAEDPSIEKNLKSFQMWARVGSQFQHAKGCMGQKI